MFGRDILQNFAYRSICEHIRRAHPDNWIPKLPASAETFAKMVSLSSRGGVLAGGYPPVRKPAPSALSSVYRKTSKRKLSLAYQKIFVFFLHFFFLHLAGSRVFFFADHGLSITVY